MVVSPGWLSRVSPEASLTTQYIGMSVCAGTRVRTNKPRAQDYFNQGLTFFYGFDPESALPSFHQASVLDSKLAMAYWGVALAASASKRRRAGRASRGLACMWLRPRMMIRSLRRPAT
jgi:hypothetical protein